MKNQIAKYYSDLLEQQHHKQHDTIQPVKNNRASPLPIKSVTSRASGIK